jgi:hypothetical protein
MKKIILLILMLSLTPISVSQDANESEIEEIIVIGELSRRAVRAQIIRVESDIYSFYNEHNGNPELDIECREVALTGTLIPQRVCEPVFWTKARNRQVQGLIHEWSGIAELENLSQEVVLETEEMNKVYAELLAQYPSFAEALLILEDLKGRLEELGN